MPSRLLLIDSASVYYRAFHGVPSSVTAPDGTPVNAVRGFLDLVARVIAETRPTDLVCCWDDDWRPAFRVAAVPSYKAHRTVEGGAEDEPAALTAQLPVLIAVLEAVGLTRVGVAGYEADDVIGGYAHHAQHPVDIVTGDRDLLQLVRDDAPVRVLYTVEKLKPYDEAAVSAKHGIPGRAYADYAILRGDPSDGLPGVPGVGAKTAAALVTRFGSLDGILAALADGTTEGFPAGARARLEAARDYLAAGPAVTRVAVDLPLPAVDTGLPAAPVDPERLVDLSARWGLDGSLTRLLAALRAAGA